MCRSRCYKSDKGGLMENTTILQEELQSTLTNTAKKKTRLTIPHTNKERDSTNFFEFLIDFDYKII